MSLFFLFQDKLLENNTQLLELDLETEELMTSIEEIAQDNLAKQQVCSFSIIIL